MFPDGNFSLRAMSESHYCSRSGTREARNVSGRPASSETSPNGREQAARFGAAVRERREALGMRQDDLALATGLGRRFIIELEAGKPTCQLGKALLVAEAVGLRPLDLMSAGAGDDNALLPDLPDDLPELPDDMEAPARG